MHIPPPVSATELVVLPDSSEPVLRTLIMASPLAIYLLDREERVGLWNPAAERIFGWKAEEVIGRINPTIPADRWDEASRFMQAILHGESVTEQELRRLRKDGSYVEVGIAAARLCDSTGTPSGVVVIAADITDRHRMEAERAVLLERERLARAAAEAAERRARFLVEAGALLDASLDYHTSLRSLSRFVVPAVAGLCLIDELDSRGVSRVAVAHADPALEPWVRHFDHRALDSLPSAFPIAQVLRSGDTLYLEAPSPELVAWLVAAGRTMPRRADIPPLHSLLILPLVARGRTLGTLTLAASAAHPPFGATDVGMLEELARRAALAVDTARLYQQARQAVRARERLLAVVSHDLRNSLATVLLNSSAMLQEPEVASLGSVEREQLQWIARSAEQMGRLINDLLDVSTIESGHLSVEPSEHRVEALLRDALELCRPIAQEKRLSCSWEALPGVPPVRVDYHRLQQVLGNLLGNAIKFSPSGGTITARAEPTDAGEVRFSVADSGPGIPDRDREAVFDLFWHGTGGLPGGLGLGLAISKGIVEAHGGRIWVESAPGRGSTFFFTVPAAL